MGTADYKLQLLEQTYNLFQGQPASIAGSLVSAQIYDIDDFTDIDVFFDSSQALHYGLAHAVSQGYTIAKQSKRKLGFTHRWGGKGFHVETYRLDGPDGNELNISKKLLGGQPVRTLTGVLHSFDFGFLLAGYDCLMPTFEDAWLDLRPAYFPKQMAAGEALPMIPDKGRAWVAGEFGQNNAIRQAHRAAKYGLRGYDLTAIAPQLVTGYRIAAEDQLERDTDPAKDLAEAYLAIADLLEFHSWDLLMDSCKQLGFNEPIEHIKAVFD